MSPRRKDPRQKDSDQRESAKGSIVDKMLELAGQSHRGKVKEKNSKEDVKRNDRGGEIKKYVKEKEQSKKVTERPSVIKSNSERGVNDSAHFNKSEKASASKSLSEISDSKDVELLEARKRKFETSEVSVEKKTISLKGIAPKKMDRSKRESKDGDGLKKSKSSSESKEKRSSKDNKSEKSSRKVSSEPRKSAKLTINKRKSRESVKSTKTSGDDDSDEDASRSAMMDDSESDSDEDTWRNKKSSVSERNQDDIDRERRKRLEAAREKEREEYRAQREERRKREERERKQEEEERKKEMEERKKEMNERKKEMDERKKLVEDKKYHEKRERKERSLESSKLNKESKVKEHRRKRFVELEGSDDDDDDDDRKASVNKSGPITSIVLPNKKADCSKAQKGGRTIVARDNEETDDSVSTRNLSKTDARHLIRYINKEGNKEDNKIEEEDMDEEEMTSSSKMKGKASPVVIFKYDTGKY